MPPVDLPAPAPPAAIDPVRQRRRRRRRREREEEEGGEQVKRQWVRPFLHPERRMKQGLYENLIKELEQYDRKSYVEFMRMTPEMFEMILQRISARITKKNTNCRPALEPGLKLAATLYYLSTAHTYKAVQWDFRCAKNTASLFVPAVCQAICDEFADEIRTPNNPPAWLNVANDFETKWNFPHCIGAIDGKHVAIQKPNKSGSFYYNYKKFFSIVLLAVVDANYKFLYVDVGSNGSGSDAGIFNDTQLMQMLQNDAIGLPEPSPLVPNGPPIPYFLVGDDAFALKHWMQKPVPLRGLTVEQRIFNYRLSRARRVVENAFGILSAKYQLLKCTIPLPPEQAALCVQTCCILHNMLRTFRDEPEHVFDREDPATRNVIEGEWRRLEGLVGLRRVNRGHQTRRGQQLRQELINYVNSRQGAVAWQNDMI